MHELSAFYFYFALHRDVGTCYYWNSYYMIFIPLYYSDIFPRHVNQLYIAKLIFY